jgi:3-oxoacyl-(acyl-carrier-protein) synthase
VKNCDELFDMDDYSVSIENGEDILLLAATPSYEIYMKMVSAVKTVNGSLYSHDGKFKSIWKNMKLCASSSEIKSEDIIKRIAKEYDTDQFWNIDAKIWNLMDITPWRYLYDVKMLDTVGSDNCFNRFWIEMFSKDVLPCIALREVNMKIIDIWKLKSRFSTNEPVDNHSQDEINDSIAIVGQSCRFPGANSINEFWELLDTGGDGITSIPLERLPECFSEDPRYTSIKAGFLKCPIDEFDAKFFGISPREASFMDPQQRLMVEVAWEALENAGINPDKLKGSNTGVFSGVWTHEYERLLTESSTNTGRDFHHVILGNAFSATSARVSYFLGLNGPNVATESGCSSSMVSLHLACDSLKKRETDLALATGANLLIAHFPHSEVAILAKDGHCKTFDEKADGFARAEGVAVLVLKRYSDALKDGDRILALIRGSALSNEGTTSSFGTPSKYCQQIAIRDALKVSKVHPADVDYIEAHGTGTPIGDPIEFAAISAGYKAERQNPIIVGSVKTNTGHTESAAGLAGIIKVILAMENEVIPAHRNLDVVNPNIDLESIPAVIPIHPIPWPRNNERKRWRVLVLLVLVGPTCMSSWKSRPWCQKRQIS